MMKRKGGYTGDRRHAIKFHASSGLRHALLNLAEERNVSLAWVVRALIEKALNEDLPVPRPAASTTDGL